MTYFRLISTLLLTCGSATAVVISGTVTVDEALFRPPGTQGSVNTVFTGGTGVDGLGASWDFSPVNLDTFEVEDWTVGIGFSYFELPFGTPISQNAPPTGPALITNLSPPSIPRDQFSIPLGRSIFLGLEFESDLQPDFRTYGWVELENNGGIISAAGSATAYNVPGIIVGTTTAIPEPSSILLFGTASLAALCRRRNSRSSNS